MPTREYTTYLQSSAWQQKRQEALRRDQYRCRLCNSRARLEVHHRTYTRLGNECVEDLTTLCGACHHRHHGRQEDTARRPWWQYILVVLGQSGLAVLQELGYMLLRLLGTAIVLIVLFMGLALGLRWLIISL